MVAQDGRECLPQGLATDGQAVWVLTATGSVVRIDPATNKAGAGTQLGGTSDLYNGIAVDKNGVWATDWDTRTLYRVDPATTKVVAKIPAGLAPKGVLATGKSIWVADTHGGHGDGFDADGNNVNQQVWVMDTDGSNAHALTSGVDPKDQVPDWSPDGSRIAYSSGQPGSGGIWTMNADGSNQRRLTGCGPTDPTPCPAGDDWGTAWSPDGSKIAFLRDLTGLGIADRPVYVMNADGSDPTRITPALGIHAVPAWQPRGVGD